MAGTKEVRNKIVSVQNMKKMTKAMEMISASKMRKSEEKMLSSRPYAETIHKIINHITLLNNIDYNHSYLSERNIKCVGYLVVSTDRGLAGSLNTNLFKKVLEELKEWNERNIKTKLALIGCKAISFFNSLGSDIISQITGIGEHLKVSELISLIKEMLQAYDRSYLDKIYIANNKFVNKMSQIPQIIQVLPIPQLEESNLKKKSWDYLYEPNLKIILDTILHYYVKSQIYQSVVENLASEQAARMVAMKTATDNSSNLIKELQFIYNKARQTSITKEINEIVSGAAAV